MQESSIDSVRLDTKKKYKLETILKEVAKGAQEKGICYKVADSNHYF